MEVNFNAGWKYCIGNLMPRDETNGWGGAKSRAYSFGAVARTLDDSRWTGVDLPHDFVLSDNYTREYNIDESINAIPSMEAIDNRHFAGGSLKGGVCWYRKHFQPEGLGIAPCEDHRVFLCFDGVYRDCTVYINEY